MEQCNFRAPNIISWGLSFIKFQDGTLNFISLATITSAHQWITDWQEHSWIMEQYRSLPVTAFCENGQTEQIELLGKINKTRSSPYWHLSNTHINFSFTCTNNSLKCCKMPTFSLQENLSQPLITEKSVILPSLLHFKVIICTDISLSPNYFLCG